MIKAISFLDSINSFNFPYVPIFFNILVYILHHHIERTLLRCMCNVQQTSLPRHIYCQDMSSCIFLLLNTIVFALDEEIVGMRKDDYLSSVDLKSRRSRDVSSYIDERGQALVCTPRVKKRLK